MKSWLLIGKENFIDHIRCVNDRNILFWKKSHKKIQEGDIIYLFISGKDYNNVMFRLKVTDTSANRDDQTYWHRPFEPDDNCFVFENIPTRNPVNGPGRDELESHGISRHVQYKLLDDEQASWLESHFD